MTEKKRSSHCAIISSVWTVQERSVAGHERDIFIECARSVKNKYYKSFMNLYQLTSCDECTFIYYLQSNRNSSLHLFD